MLSTRSKLTDGRSSAEIGLFSAGLGTRLVARRVVFRHQHLSISHSEHGDLQRVKDLTFRNINTLPTQLLFVPSFRRFCSRSRPRRQLSAANLNGDLLCNLNNQFGAAHSTGQHIYTSVDRFQSLSHNPWLWTWPDSPIHQLPP